MDSGPRISSRAIRGAATGLLLAAAAFGSPPPQEAPTPSHAQFDYEQGGKRVKVWYYAPPYSGPGAPVVFVLHGRKRDGENYLQTWIPHAQKRRFVLVAPEFSEKEFPGADGYNLGNVADHAGRLLPRNQWGIAMIEPIFDEIRRRVPTCSDRYRVFGFSAGAQFVERFAFLVPHPRASLTVISDAGWYMMPDFSLPFPMYGMKAGPLSPSDLSVAYGLAVVLLLGTADIDTRDPVLSHTPEAEAQGPHRFARGRTFYESCRASAASLGAPFRWLLELAPGVGHSDPDMAPFAAKILVPGPDG